MFIGRSKELARLEEFFSNPRKRAALIYGKRRVGKSTLVRKASENFDGVVISYLSLIAPFKINLDSLSDLVLSSFGESGEYSFSSLDSLFRYLKGKKERILLIIDEYQYFKRGTSEFNLDSVLQKAIDSGLGENIKLIVSGSFISMMLELLEGDNPLYDRFSLILHLEDMDYFDAFKFLPSSSLRKKVEYFSVFGGSPNVLEVLEEKKSLRENIISLLLDNNAYLKAYIENDLLLEFNNLYNLKGVLSVLGNGKKRFTEISDKLGPINPSLLLKTLETLQEVGMVRSVFPINKEGNRKYKFYEISNNLVRFYYAYIYKNQSRLRFSGPEVFYSQIVEPRLDEFISHRFESLVKEYFSRAVRTGNEDPQIEEVGTYWYDDRITGRNGEFDCALKKGNFYTILEVKLLMDKMSLSLAKKEEEKIRLIPDLPVERIGFVSLTGFDFENSEYKLITGEDLVARKLEE